jgi:hypothetical protein
MPELFQCQFLEIKRDLQRNFLSSDLLAECSTRNEHHFSIEFCVKSFNDIERCRFGVQDYCRHWGENDNVRGISFSLLPSLFCAHSVLLPCVVAFSFIFPFFSFSSRSLLARLHQHIQHDYKPMISYQT